MVAVSPVEQHLSTNCVIEHGHPPPSRRHDCYGSSLVHGDRHRCAQLDARAGNDDGGLQFNRRREDETQAAVVHGKSSKDTEEEEVARTLIATRNSSLPLAHLAQLPTVDDSIRIPENKVPGCLSTVHVDCTTEEKDGDTLVNYVGDSDGLLTKGLLALLIRGLSGCTAEQIAAVDPQFIQAAKISQTLTPGRNNGFLNMLAVMKKKASDAVEGGDESPASGDAAGAENSGEVVTSFDEVEGKPMYNAILSTLVPILKPVSIELVDNSSQHAGHGGAKVSESTCAVALQL